MKLLTISVATPKTISHNGKMIETGIFKTPVSGSHRVTANGLTEDHQVDRENHGGPDKAIYVYTVENYAYWEKELNQTWEHGHFGENFTVTRMEDQTVHIGDIFLIGRLTVQVTQPRVPCFKLGIKMGDASFVKRFHRSGRVGFYLRVLQEEYVTAGDSIELLQADPAEVKILDAMTAMIPGDHQADAIARALSVPALSAAWQESLHKRQREL